MALFLFFLFPTAIFGAVAYGAVAREVVLSAAAQAHRALEQASPAVLRERLPEVGSEIGTDLLLYQHGLLVGAAAPEILDLGLFHSWLSPSVFLDFASGEDTEAQENRRLGESEYLVAYRRLDPERVLAAPIPLASQEITRRQREFRDIALLVSLLGAALSIILSLLVARALSRPLAQLSHAAVTVGGGDLRVRLPEREGDEFGSVYQSFNQMVQRLRRARVDLAREARRTETIVAEAATGVLALDGRGRVELVNPRAAEILGGAPVPGEPLPDEGPLLVAIKDALREFRRSTDAEAGRELEIDSRIVRLRLRKLASAEGPRGMVVALEDVTSEVRTARVLAWGEMARQVAHEIKNPLTPIKLSVQHLRRAYADRRSDFAEILDRNVEAVLEEIDRLGEIARAFARFGAPQHADVGLEKVDVASSLRETLALYRSGGPAGIRLEVDAPTDVPVLAIARAGELKEVLINLLENAREALDGSGVVRVSVARDEERGCVEIVVADTGEGIRPDLLARIFEPHFSTRTSGTGLGLAIVKRIVESWGGSIEAESAPGTGTRMRVRLEAVTSNGNASCAPSGDQAD
jgi:two-component system nitrogen regulation sensor histidine kinase NtrY